MSSFVPARRLRAGLNLFLVVAVLMAAVFIPLPTPGQRLPEAEAAPLDAPLDFTVPNGRFFTQANGMGGGGTLGYKVTDEGGVFFWTAFQKLGGQDVVGYPVSRRFNWNGFVVQAFQKLVLQWRPESGGVVFVNVFDELNQAGKNDWLRNVRSTPAPVSLDEKGKSWDQIVAGRIAILDANPDIKNFYLTTPDYFNRYGLPVSKVTDVGNAYVVRFQRAVMQQWKVDVPWAKAGQVTVANGGDIGKEANIYPKTAIAPENSGDDANWSAMPRNTSSLTVAIDPGHGGAEIGAAHLFSDGTKLLEKDVNLKVALKVSDALTALGYKVVMTRRADTRVAVKDWGAGVALHDDLQARIDIANQAHADIFVVTHENGIANPGVRGTEVYYCADRPFAEKSRKLATYTNEGLVRVLGGVGYATANRGAKDDAAYLGKGNHYYLLGPQSNIIKRPSQMPAIIGEGLFLSNDDEANLLRQDYFLSAIASGYVMAINRYFASEGK